ncbi:multimeric flavodoxin WrbA [Desulfitispora alkaliphila]|uniref:flavodoxin family protein n=1 Tax=Desulfitispora alkaliphila TaxID=622674 RepID=UPI003D1D0CE7
MKVLGIVGSSRKRGNSELLLRLALKGATEQGAQVEKLRLGDYEIKSCTGCMSCIFNDTDCHLDDDAAELFQKIIEADGIIIAAPTYVLGPAASTKLFLDRFLMLGRKMEQIFDKRGVAATINTAGLPQWNSLGEYLNIVPVAFGYRLVDTLTAYGPGPGEPLLEEGMSERATELGRKMVAVWKGEGEPREPEKNQCPVCYCETFKLGAEGELRCAICDAGAKVTSASGEQWQLEFSKEECENNRFSRGNLTHHINDWIIGSKDRYIAKLPQIKAKLFK